MTNFIRYFAATAAIGGLSAPLAAQNPYPNRATPNRATPNRATPNRAIRSRLIPTITTRATGRIRLARSSISFSAIATM